ncbi:RIP metalloprotease RseP [Chondromyces apiculatus]|uniref:Intramembrane protease RasP/YluC, implicated in cell division based on FtsL cleavage n=1 Tax=Chondromyces apiculatus DSM 436 TaxID=1192034 RepID=A0A017SYX9_9BACT|nr:RIP metalloprotease RseP [Chondromyces apiculatus]EYF02153.1 Intramembrane protease RasP/YluC, implicated in cell division based on FtsL cleavage [Chondromyces apiculatus DSM 436]
MDLLYFALLCSVLIFVHELGHFVCAKLFGVKVLTFSIGFGPKVLRLRGRETEYCVGLLPLGGFVKMLEENRQEPVLPEDRRRTFEAQALWKRVIIVLAGPAMNVLFPVLLYFAVFIGETRFVPPTVGSVLPAHPAEGKLRPGDRILEVDGERITTFAELQRMVARSPGQELKLKVFRDREHVDVTVIPEEKVVQKPLEIVERIGELGIRPSRPAAVIGISRLDSPAFRAGLRTFDLVTEVSGRPIKTWSDLEQALMDNRGATVPVTYLRPVPVTRALGGLADLAVYESGVAALTPETGAADLQSRTGIEHADLYVAEVPEGSPEWKADLRVGDRVVEVDGVEVTAWSTFTERLFAAPDKPHVITWLRAGQRKSGTIELRREEYLDEYGQYRPRFFLRAANWSPMVPEPYVEGGPAAIRLALESALDETYDVIRFIMIGIVRIVEGKVSISTLGGPITVYDVVGEEGAKGVSYFVWAMAVISINLGLINLLPIPVLDGGHLLFFTFEAVLRRPLPLRVREIASLAGLVVLVGLMGIAFKNDVERRWDVIQGQLRELAG